MKVSILPPHDDVDGLEFEMEDAATVAQLKEKCRLFGHPLRVYCMGYQICGDGDGDSEVMLKDFVDAGFDTFSLALAEVQEHEFDPVALPGRQRQDQDQDQGQDQGQGQDHGVAHSSMSWDPFRVKTRKVTTDEERFIVTGDRKRFQCILMLPGKPTRVKLKSKQFGLVYHTEGEKNGERKYHVDVYLAKEEGSIEIRKEDNQSRVFLVRKCEAAGGDAAEAGEYEEEELDADRSETYNELHNLPPQDKWDKVERGARLGLSLTNFVAAIGGLVFGA